MRSELPSDEISSELPRPRYGIRRNITWLGTASLAIKPVWLVFVVVLCWRYLGTAGYGVFSAALWLTHIPVSFTEIGLATFTTREIARSPQRASIFFSNIAAFKLAIGPIAWLVAILIGVGLGYERAQMLSVVWAGIYAISLSLTSYVRSFFQAFEDLRLEAISVVSEKVLVISFGLLALIVFQTPDGTLAGMACSMVVIAGANALWVSRNLAAFRIGLIQWSFIVDSLKSALPLGLAAFFAVVYLRTGGVLLEYWHGEAVTGLFAGPFRVLEALFLIIVVFAAAVLPRLSSLFHGGDVEAFRSVFKRSTGAAVALTVICSLGISLFSDPIIGIINPEPEAAPAGNILRVLIWLLPLITGRELLVSALIAADQQVFLARMFAVYAAASFGLNILLTLPLGVSGVLMVFVLTEVLILLTCGHRYIRTLNREVRR